MRFLSRWCVWSAPQPSLGPCCSTRMVGDARSRRQARSGAPCCTKRSARCRKPFRVQRHGRVGRRLQLCLGSHTVRCGPPDPHPTPRIFRDRITASILLGVPRCEHSAQAEMLDMRTASSRRNRLPSTPDRGFDPSRNPDPTTNSLTAAAPPRLMAPAGGAESGLSRRAPLLVDERRPRGPSQWSTLITRPSSRMSPSILANPLGSTANVSPSNDTKGTSALTEFIATTV